MKHVMIQYRLRDDANLEEVQGAIRRFVGGLREASAKPLSPVASTFLP